MLFFWELCGFVFRQCSIEACIFLCNDRRRTIRKTPDLKRPSDTLQQINFKNVFVRKSTGRISATIFDTVWKFLTTMWRLPIGDRVFAFNCESSLLCAHNKNVYKTHSIGFADWWTRTLLEKVWWSLMKQNSSFIRFEFRYLAITTVYLPNMDSSMYSLNW